MVKKIVAFFTTVTFIVFIVSCYTMKKIRPELGKENDKVIGIEKITGEHISFPKDEPAVIHNKSVQMKQSVKKEVQIEIDRKSISRIVKNEKEEIIIIQTVGGIEYKVLRTILENPDRIKILAEINDSELLSIAFQELRAIWISKYNATGSLGIVIIPLIVLILSSLVPKIKIGI